MNTLVVGLVPFLKDAIAKLPASLRLLQTLVLSFLVLTLMSESSVGGTITATKAKFTGRVTVAAGAANDTKRVEQSTTPAGATFVDTGSSISTDAAGNGTVSIANVSSGTLLVGHNVRAVCTGGVICGPALVTAVGGWFASYTPGIEQDVSIVVPQSVIGDDGSVLLETWETGAIWTLRFDPNEANWVDTGSISIGSVEGDLMASILSVTATDIVFQILSDLSPLTSNSILIEGARLNVPSTGTTVLNPLYGLQGNVSAYLDGVVISSQSFPTEEFVDATRISGDPVSVPEPSTLILMFIGLGTLAAFSVRSR